MRAFRATCDLPIEPTGFSLVAESGMVAAGSAVEGRPDIPGGLSQVRNSIVWRSSSAHRRCTPSRMQSDGRGQRRGLVLTNGAAGASQRSEGPPLSAPPRRQAPPRPHAPPRPARPSRRSPVAGRPHVGTPRLPCLEPLIAGRQAKILANESDLVLLAHCTSAHDRLWLALCIAAPSRSHAR